MPRALEVLDATLRRIEQSQIDGIEALDHLLIEGENRRIKRYEVRFHDTGTSGRWHGCATRWMSPALVFMPSSTVAPAFAPGRTRCW